MSMPDETSKLSLARRVGNFWRKCAPSFDVPRKFFGLTVYFDCRDNLFYWTLSRSRLEAIEPIFNYLKQFDRPVWDVGANIGLFSLRAAQLGNKVVAFDISAKALSLLTRSAKVNNLAVTVVPRAFGVTDFEYTPPTSAHTENRLGTSPAPGTATTAHSMTYREAAQLYGIPSVIKMDIEGHEEAFLKDADFKRWLIDNRVIWLLEAHEARFKDMIGPGFDVSTADGVHLWITPKS